LIRIIRVQPQPQPVDDGSHVLFIGDDNKGYDALFTNEARRQLMQVLQIEEARHREANRATLTVKDHTVSLSREGNALTFVTEEAGAIALRIPREMIAAIQQDLGQLARMPQRS
jgi:hypothetical protein